MKIYLASDHAGFELKKRLSEYLEGAGFNVTDCGPKQVVEGDDYPDWVALAAKEVSKNPEEARGIVVGLSGQGEAMVANKFPRVRCGVFYGGSEEILKLLRQHNDANMLSFGAKFISPEDAEKAADMWLSEQFSNDPRHARRIEKIIEIEKQLQGKRA
jgi:ribose 5-phosphate isomerase B